MYTPKIYTTCLQCGLFGSCCMSAMWSLCKIRFQICTRLDFSYVHPQHPLLASMPWLLQTTRQQLLQGSIRRAGEVGGHETFHKSISNDGVMIEIHETHHNIPIKL
uniref:Uncharacterized protein n=1 Tax=Opuntia streptacantha TaxID=393608 RepID=A0A7C8YWV0_OPUST